MDVKHVVENKCISHTHKTVGCYLDILI